MDYRQAYQSLLEIFPQVDNRILKAVAIEHRNDVHAAVEVIICDVLPFQLSVCEGAEAPPSDMSSSVDGNIIDLGDSVSGLSRDDNSAGGEDHCRNVIDLTDGDSVVGDSEDYFENVIGFTESVVESSQDRNSVTGKIEDEYENLDESHMEPLPCDTEAVYQEEDTPTIWSTRNVINIDVLEACVTEAKSNKRDLASAMESIVDLTRVAEILEERAKHAKEEASPAGQDIVAQVEALKQMLQHAKQTNDMHAGEVYGEKSILLTEARELQSRLLNLSDERNKFCSIINEIRETLEARIAAARGEIAAAEQEKLEKEGLAKKALKEQEALLEAIAQESKKLQQEAEENAKLRDFLVDRGQLVDTLQGEMAVIFEDVTLLKRRVDERVPLKGSLLMRTYSSASSSSSYSQKSIHSADALLVHVEQGGKTREGIEDQQSPALEKVVTVGNSEKANAGCREEAIADDDWELLNHNVCPV